MIFVRNGGWMCNNILQYGHAYAWGREHGCQTVSMRFCYKFQYFNICHTKWHWFVTYLFAKWGAALKLIPVVSFPFEKGHDTTDLERQMLQYKHCVVEGWRVEFPELFIKYKQEIVSLFQFDRKISHRVAEKMKQCDQGKSLRLGVHMRRGDYKTWMGGKYFYNDETFAGYIRSFIEMHPDKEVSVFLSTNDKNVSTETFKELCHCEQVFKLESGNAADDLCLLSQCDAIIGPPSTFSLIGALLGRNNIHWMSTSDSKELKEQGFQTFEELFTHVI